MAIFRRFVEDLYPQVPTVWRRTAGNILDITNLVLQQAQDAVAEALYEYVEAWPIDTAPAWVLDTHWGPYHNLQRNGMSDATYRTYIHAKRLLNKSWGAIDQALEIFHLLIPAATLSFDYTPPKSWTINISGVEFADAVPAVLFMRKGPSPEGGGFSAAGDNGNAVIADKKVFSFSTTYGVAPASEGWYSSVYGASGGDEAGWAHVEKI